VFLELTLCTTQEHRNFLSYLLTSTNLAEASKRTVMCILPNFATRDFTELKQNRKKETEKAEAKTVEIIIPEQPSLDSTKLQ
jgi:hypothetical protein